MVTRKTVIGIINKYKNAWVNRDPEAIVKIFSKNGKYQERVLKRPLIGHSKIKRYWQDKVVGEQKDIKFKLLHLYISGSTAIAEWDARFYDKKNRDNVHIREIAVLEIKGHKISSLREYWSSIRTKMVRS